MGRRKSAKQLERELQYAKAREAYNTPAREDGAATQRRPKIDVTYAVLSSLAPANSTLTIQASQKGVAFFGGISALGLTDKGTAPRAPRGFQPAKILAMVADGTPTTVRARGSGRPYIRYGSGSRGGASQYNYSAPISASTEAGIDEKVKAVVEAKQGSLGSAYGRIWFESERYPYAASGAGGGGEA